MLAGVSNQQASKLMNLKEHISTVTSMPVTVLRCCLRFLSLLIKLIRLSCTELVTLLNLDIWGAGSRPLLCPPLASSPRP
ncbi:hypothetical protein ABBQ38_012732 [Trebouxia sp. C0009 RCD-2024]